MNKFAIQGVNSNLKYAEEDVDAASQHAAMIKDPELTNKLGDLKTRIVGIKDYIKSKTDSKIG